MRPLCRLATVAVVREGRAPQPPELDLGGLSQEGAGGAALDLGEEALEAGAAVGAGQVQGGERRQQRRRHGMTAGVGGGVGGVWAHGAVSLSL